jgi:L-threonylcarbamoyladenylate synthase
MQTGTAVLERAIAALALAGGVVLYPTQTLYGFGGRASDDRSAERIAAIKGRSPGGLIVLAEQPPLVGAIARALAEAFWPGPLTLVLPAWPGLAPSVLGPDGTVAVRRPVHPVARALVAAVGPITSTSANASGEPPLLDPRGSRFPVDVVVDVGRLAPSAPSTIVRFDTGQVLREGAIPAARIERVLEATR